MKLICNNVVFKNITSKADKNGVLYWHGYLNEVGTRDCISVNIDESFRTLIPETPCNVVLNYRFSVVTKGADKSFYHNFDVCEILPR